MDVKNNVRSDQCCAENQVRRRSEGGHALRCTGQQGLPEKVTFSRVLDYTKKHMEKPRGKAPRQQEQ